jgi:hypothetical protein
MDVSAIDVGGSVASCCAGPKGQGKEKQLTNSGISRAFKSSLAKSTTLFIVLNALCSR